MRSSLRTLALLLPAFVLALPVAQAHALGSNGEVLLDANTLTELEARALHAEAREQCFLYTQLARSYSEIASKQIAAGEMEKAALSLRHLQQISASIHVALAGNAKKVKESQVMLHAATFRLGECIRYVSAEDKTAVQATLKELNKVNDELLAQVFAH